MTPTVAAYASKNNELGLPLTVLRLEPETRVLVAEMGMRGLGQIAELCEVARPTVALVTSIGPEHLEVVGTVENVARANAEAIEALPTGGIAVVPADEPLLEPYLRDELDVRRFDRSAVERDGEAWVFPVSGREIRLELPFTQRHLAGNVVGALTAYDALGPSAGPRLRGRVSDQHEPLARRGARAARGRPRRQRRLQREPRLDARGAPRPRRARRRTDDGS